MYVCVMENYHAGKVRVCPALQKESHHVALTLFGRYVQRSAAILQQERY